MTAIELVVGDDGGDYLPLINQVSQWSSDIVQSVDLAAQRELIQ